MPTTKWLKIRKTIRDKEARKSISNLIYWHYLILKCQDIPDDKRNHYLLLIQRRVNSKSKAEIKSAVQSERYRQGISSVYELYLDMVQLTGSL